MKLYCKKNEKDVYLVKMNDSEDKIISDIAMQCSENYIISFQKSYGKYDISNLSPKLLYNLGCS